MHAALAMFQALQLHAQAPSTAVDVCAADHHIKQTSFAATPALLALLTHMQLLLHFLFCCHLLCCLLRFRAGSWLPGYSDYILACNRLDSIVEQILTQRRAAQAGATSSSRSSQDILGYLLQAQQQQGADAISDAAIGDEVKTMIFAGSDTSSFTLAVLAHYLALHPAAADRAAAEVAALLQKSGRGHDVSQLRAEDAARLPFVTACVNETLRLSPAGPAITRTACQVGWGVWGRLETSGL
jgi:cytochrome P450